MLLDLGNVGLFGKFSHVPKNLKSFTVCFVGFSNNASLWKSFEQCLVLKDFTVLRILNRVTTAYKFFAKKICVYF